MFDTVRLRVIASGAPKPIRKKLKASVSNKKRRDKLGDLAMDKWLTIAIIIVLLWLVGFFALPGVGALIHILLVIAVILVVVWLLTGKKLWR